MTRSRLAWPMAFVLFAVAAIGHFITLKNRDAWAPGAIADYTSLYCPAEVPGILRIGEADGHLRVAIQGIDAEGNTVVETVTAELQDGRREYAITPAKASAPSPILLYVDFEANRPPSKRAWILRSNVPAASASSRFPVQHWTAGYWDAAPPRLIEQARARLTPLNLESLPGTIPKIQKLADFIYGALDHHRGASSPRLAAMGGLETFEAMTADKEVGWCSDFAKAYAAYGNLAGLQVRLVTLFRQTDDLLDSGHTVCEVFVPEQMRWAYVDPLSGHATIATDGGLVLNTVQLHELWNMDPASFRPVITLAQGATTNLNSFERFFGNHVRILFPTAEQVVGGKLNKALAHIFDPKQIDFRDPEVIFRSRLNMAICTIAGVVGAVMLAILLTAKLWRGQNKGSGEKKE